MSEFGDTSYTLLHRACDLHDEQAWAELVEHYRRFIFFILQQMGVGAADIEDVSQQVLFSLTKDLCSYDPSRARFRTWLSTVIRNAALVHFRKKKTRQNYIRIFGEEQSLVRLEEPSDVDQRIEQEWAAYVSGL